MLIYNMNKFTEESAKNLKRLINQVDKALYSWAKEQQIEAMLG